MPQVGDTLPLYIQLFDNATDKFPRAIVRDAANAEVAGSPFDLSHIADGLYGSLSAQFPNTQFVTAQYLIYDDAAHTQIALDQGSGLDYFLLEADGSGLSDLVTASIKGIIDGDECRESRVQDQLVRGEDRTFVIRLVRAENGEPYSLSSVTLLQARFLNADRTTLTISSADAGSPINTLNSGGGKVAVTISAAQSANLLAPGPNKPAPFVLVLTFSDGKKALCNFNYQLAVVDPLVAASS